MRAGNQRRLKGRLDRMRHARHRGALIEKWKESLRSVLPITAIVIALGLLAVPAPSGAMLAFLAGAVLLVVGMGLFTLGTDLAMIPIGEHVGAAMTRSKKLWVVLLCSFLVGVIVTISEPDLQVLARRAGPDADCIGSAGRGRVSGAGASAHFAAHPHGVAAAGVLCAGVCAGAVCAGGVSGRGL